MGRICAIVGCSNSTAKLNVWLSQTCDIHGLKYGSCICEPPFQLFGFPTQLQDQEGRCRWIKVVNRKAPSGQNWQPNDNSRICSAHFKEKEPTVAWPDPTENLGSKKEAQKSPRNPPDEIAPDAKPLKRESVHKKRKSEDTNIENVISEPGPNLKEAEIEGGTISRNKGHKIESSPRSSSHGTPKEKSTPTKPGPPRSVTSKQEFISDQLELLDLQQHHHHHHLHQHQHSQQHPLSQQQQQQHFMTEIDKKPVILVVPSIPGAAPSSSSSFSSHTSSSKTASGTTPMAGVSSGGGGGGGRIMTTLSGQTIHVTGTAGSQQMMVSSHEVPTNLMVKQSHSASSHPQTYAGGAGTLNAAAVIQQLQQQRPSAPQSKYAELLAVIEDMGRDIRPTYAGSRTATERLRRGITHAKALVRECLAETERSART